MHESSARRRWRVTSESPTMRESSSGGSNRECDVQNGTVTFRLLFYPYKQGVEQLERTEHSGLGLIGVA